MEEAGDASKLARGGDLLAEFGNDAPATARSGTASDATASPRGAGVEAGADVVSLDSEGNPKPRPKMGDSVGALPDEGGDALTASAAGDAVEEVAELTAEERAAKEGQEKVAAHQAALAAAANATAAQELANKQIREFLSTGLASFESDAFRVTLDEETWMGIADTGTLRAVLPPLRPRPHLAASSRPPTG